MGICVLWNLHLMVRRRTWNCKICIGSWVVCDSSGWIKFIKLHWPLHNLPNDKKFQTAYCAFCNNHKKSDYSVLQFSILQPPNSCGTNCRNIDCSRSSSILICQWAHYIKKGHKSDKNWKTTLGWLRVAKTQPKIINWVQKSIKYFT